ncbi:tetraacyldisaccharide 4'-kinase [Candidatus Omnitrophota bacterium]
MRSYLYGLATDKYRGFFTLLPKAVLWMLSLIYGSLVKILAFIYLFKPQRLKAKVVSIGNITLGGSGKTPLVEFTVRLLTGQGRKVAVLSRGYKRRRQSGWESMGDEPYMLEQKLGGIPVIIDKDRVRSANLAVDDYGVDTVILDDGMQQWRIKKDLEVVTIDATEPFGNGYLLPRGILREPLSALKRADIFVLTKTNLNPDIQDIKDQLRRFNRKAPIVESAHKPIDLLPIDGPPEIVALEALKGKRATLLSGIADPDSFENLILSLGCKPVLHLRFPDHHRYSQRDINRAIADSQRNSIDTIITTQKDAVRLQGLQGAEIDVRFLALRIALEMVRNEEEFRSRLLRLYSA